MGAFNENGKNRRQSRARAYSKLRDRGVGVGQPAILNPNNVTMQKLTIDTDDLDDRRTTNFDDSQSKDMDDSRMNMPDISVIQSYND